MKVLLVRPKPHRKTIGLQHVMICEPLELEYLSGNIPSSIRDKVEVEIVDMILENESFESILLSRKPDFVAFTGYITHVGTIRFLAGRAKTLQPGVYTAVGGVHAEVVGEDFSCDEIDFIYTWNGVKGFNLTLEALLKGEPKDSIRALLESIEKAPADYNLLPPDRAAVSKYRRRYYYMFHNPCALVKASYGCPYNCSFCFCREISKGGYHVRPIEDVKIGRAHV